MIPQHQWVSKLLGYNFNVEYRPGHMNTVIAALPRQSIVDPSLFAISSALLEFLNAIRKQILEDDYLSTLLTDINEGRCTAPWS